MTGIKVIATISIKCGGINKANFPHLQGIDLTANINCNDLDLLIGQDFSEFLLPLETRTGKRGEPYAVRYQFGWALNGKLHCNGTEHLPDEACLVSSDLLMSSPDLIVDRSSSLIMRDNRCVDHQKM
eukprot:GHVO01003529.1.p1 GENE.GHVO01003529.1~~GHVO01003529.1.p1  ORF type:complete len:127 (-),score=0.17 GHVO01003529.1:176-556(-)